MNFVSPKVACISINVLSSLPLNTVIMSGLVLQCITCICWMSYSNWYLVLAVHWTLVIVARYIELLASCRNVVSLSLLLIFLSQMFIWIVFSYSRWNYIRYSKFRDLLSPFLDAIRMSLSTLCFLVQPGSGNSFFLALNKKLYFPQCRSWKSFWFCSSWSYLVELEKSWPWRMDCSICASHVQEQPKQSKSWWQLHL